MALEDQLTDDLAADGGVSPLKKRKPAAMPGMTTNLMAGPEDVGTGTEPAPDGGIKTPAPQPTTTPAPQPGFKTGAKPTDAAQYLLSTGVKGKDLNDQLRAQGYQDNGLYYPDRDMYGFADAYMGKDAQGNWNTTQRVKETAPAATTSPIAMPGKTPTPNAGQAALSAYEQGGITGGAKVTGLSTTTNPNATTNVLSANGDATTNVTNPGIGTGTDPYGQPKAPNTPGAVDGPLVDGNPIDTSVDTSDYTPAQANAAGLAWVDRNNPSFGKPGFVGSRVGGTNSGTPGTPGNNGPGTDLESMMARIMAQQEAERVRRQGFSDTIHSGITGAIADAQAPVDENSAAITQPMRAFSGQTDRAMAAGREAMAARGQLQGMTTGANDAALQSSYENVGADKGGFQANLIVDQMKQKQQKLQSMLQLGAGQLTAEEAQGIQKQMALLDARIKEMDLKQSGNIANRDIDVRSQIANGQLGLGNRQEDDLMSRFYDTMGLNVGNQESALNQWLMSMLNGGG